MSSNAVPLASDFLEPSLDAWRALALKAAGADATWDLLVGATEDGIPIQPLYTMADALPDAVRPWREAAAWTICPLLDLADPGAANRQLLAELEGGAGGVLVDLEPHDVTVRDAAGLARLLDGMHLSMATLALDPGVRWREVAGWLDGLVPADALRVELGADPLAHGQDAAGLAGIARRAVVTARADGRVWHDRGATPVQEIAAVLATGVAYLRALDGDAAQIGPMVAVDADQFAGIAKLRALRRCWGRVLDASGIAGPFRIHAQTSARMLTRLDPATNLLRNTLACFAAGIGGADAVTVLPHDHAVQPGDAFSRRIARNIGHVLMDEARLHQVGDPAGGSWWVEQLTDRMAREAWALFQAIEASGGVNSGLLADKVAAAAAARSAAIASGERVIVGTTKFRRADEAPPPDRGLPVARDAAAAEAGR